MEGVFALGFDETEIWLVVFEGCGKQLTVQSERMSKHPRASSEKGADCKAELFNS